MKCACGKPGLYRVPPSVYCRDHVSEAQRKQALVYRLIDAAEGERQREIRRPFGIAEPHE